MNSCFKETAWYFPSFRLVHFPQHANVHLMNKVSHKTKKVIGKLEDHL